MALTKYKLGDLIQQRREKNKDYDVPICGVTRDGFIPPKVERVDKKTFMVFYRNDFVFNATRMELNSIIFNNVHDKGLCSPLYSMFYVTKEDILMPEYLNLYIKRSEFARRCGMLGFGSAHHKVTVDDLAEIEINLPPLPIQQKFVAVYNAMLANQRAYEHGLDDLKLTCDAYIERLRREMPYTAIGEYIEQGDERNTALNYGVDSVKGVSIEKRFIKTKADMKGVSLAPYLLVEPDAFAFVTITSRNGGKISLAHNNSSDTYICSSSYVVFRVSQKDKLIASYLKIFFNRPEFDRYARFHSWGSAREAFGWEDMKDVKIPIPDISVQQSIVNIYTAYLTRREINEKLKAQIKDICPILIKGSLEEAGI